MEIIKRGGPRAAEWNTEIDCSGCKARLKVNGNDLRYSQELMVGSYKDSECPSHFCFCPICSTKLWVYNVPVTVTIEIKNRGRASNGWNEKD